MNRTEEIKARLSNIEDIGAVVSALRALALGRQRQAAAHLKAIRAQEDAILAAMGQALALTGPPPAAASAADNANTGADTGADMGGATGGATGVDTGADGDADAADNAGGGDGPALLIVIGAGQGFTGAYGDRLAEAAGPVPGEALAVFGARTTEALTAAGATPVWTAEAPARAQEIPALAARAADFLFAEAARGAAARVRVLHGDPQDPGAPPVMRRLLPFDYASAPLAGGPPPLLTLPPAAVLAALVTEYVHAELCAALMRGFAAESAARAEAMSRAQGNIRRIAETLEGEARRARQEAMTAEIVELALCAAAPAPRRKGAARREVRETDA